MSHDIFNASATATWLECSWSALNAVPDALKKESTIAAADMGTAKHKVMEAGGMPDVEAFINQLEKGVLYREIRIRVTPECGGTVDLLNANPHVVTILDGKFGKWDVPAFHNKQLLTYGAAFLTQTPAEWWRFVIYQPDGLDEEPWKQWMAHRSEVEAHRDKVLRAVSDRGPPRPGPHCRWCKAFQACPAMANDANFTVAAMSRCPEDLTADDIVRLLRMIRALGDVKEIYEDILTAKLKMGYPAKDATLKPGRSYRAWNDDKQAAEILYSSFGARGIKPVSPAQAEKLGPIGKQYAAVGAHKPEAPLKAVY